MKPYPQKNSICRKTHYLLQCPNGVTNEFERVSYEFLTEPYRVVVHYIGNSEIAVNFPHGNSKQDVEVPYTRTCPSVLKQLKEKASGELPSNIYMKATASCTSPTHQPVLAPRNLKQVHNASYITL